MMALTHGLASVALIALALPGGPEGIAPAVVGAAFLGGVFPDADIVAEHRKTLHYPGGYTVVGLAALGVYSLSPSGALLFGCVFVCAAALHGLSDVLAGSVEAEPWKRTTERAVFNHLTGRWHRPRRYVRYSGAPEDVSLSVCCAALAIGSGATGALADSGLAAAGLLAVVYGLARHPKMPLARVRGRVPEPVRAMVTAVAIEETDSGATTLSLRKR